MPSRRWPARWSARIAWCINALVELSAALVRWTWRFLRTTWRRRATSMGGVRLSVVAALVGLGLGYLIGGDRYQLVMVTEFTLPKPVTPPPPGTVWTKVLTTGYCPCQICCGPDARGITSTGRSVRAHPFGIASDHGQVPTGVVLDLPGYGHAEVDDTGGAMRQDALRGVVHLDLRFEQHAQARRWGRRWLWIAMPR